MLILGLVFSGVAGAQQQETEDNDTTSTATAISVGDEVSGEISTSEDVDYYAVEVDEGQTVTLQATDAGDLGPDETLYFDLPGEYNDAEISADTESDTASFTAGSTDTYYISVEGFGDTGAYEFNLTSPPETGQEGEPNGVGDTATSITLDEQVSGDISTSGDVDYYTIEADEGQTVTLRATDAGDLGPEESLYFDLPGEYNDAEISADTESDTASFTAGSTDTYYISAEGFGDTGAYEFNLTSPPENGQEGEPNGVGDTATSITLDEQVSGEVSTSGDIDYYTIEADEGQTVTLQATDAGDLGPDESLYFDLPGEYNDAEISADTESDTASFTAGSTDTYYISVEGFGDTGAYEFDLTSPPENGQEGEPNGVGDTATSITLDEQVSGDISTSGDVDYYTIEADEGQTVTLQATDAGDLGPEESLYFDLPGEYNDADISADTESDTASFTAGSTDTYYISVEGFGDTGAYEFNLTSPPETGQEGEPNGVGDTATSITLDEQVSGDISTSGDVDYYTIELDEGENVTLQATDTGGLGSDESLYFDLPGEYNDAEISADTESDTDWFIASSTDTYYVSVEGFGDTGAYEFSLFTGEEPTETATPEPTPTATPEPTPTATPEPTPTATPEPTEEPEDQTTEFDQSEDATVTGEAGPMQTDFDGPGTVAESQETATTAQDSDGDGVVDSEDYAPRDADVQDREDVADEDASGGSGPGFGMGVAIVSLLAAAAIGLNRT